MNPAFLAAPIAQPQVPVFPSNNADGGADTILLTGEVQRCNYWPRCRLGDACNYWHPKEMCVAWPSCPNSASTCLYIHPEEGSKPSANGENRKAVATVSTTPPTAVCWFYPNCTNRGCTFFHPPTTDSATPSAAIHEQETLAPVNKVPVPCRDGAACARVGCHFLHPWENKMAAMPCKFGAGCTRPDCGFQHPPKTVHRNKTLVLNSSTPHITERRFAVEEEDVTERIPVVENGTKDTEGDVEMN